MMPGIGCVAAEDETRCDGAKAHDAPTKPIQGFRTNSTH